MHRARFSSEKDLRSLPSRFVLQPSAREWLALSCTHSDVVHARLAVNHGSRPHQDGQEGAFTAVDRALARSRAARPRRFRAAPRGDAIARERPRDAASDSGGRRAHREDARRANARERRLACSIEPAASRSGVSRGRPCRVARLDARVPWRKRLGFCTRASAFSSPRSPPSSRARRVTRTAADLSTLDFDSFHRRPRASSSRSTTLA